MKRTELRETNCEPIRQRKMITADVSELLSIVHLRARIVTLLRLINLPFPSDRAPLTNDWLQVDYTCNPRLRANNTWRSIGVVKRHEALDQRHEGNSKIRRHLTPLARDPPPEKCHNLSD